MSFYERVCARQELTFPVDPQEGTRSRCFPFRERVALKEPCCCTAVPQSEGVIVIFPWIRGREPSSNISPQLVTCPRISALPDSNGNAWR